MSIIHFMNVKEGDCALIQHNSGHNTVIDISNGNQNSFDIIPHSNYNQKKYPVDPIQYIKNLNISTIFRFILTHPDMDHMDGIKNLFNEFIVFNFWDTKNTKEMNDDSDWGNYKKCDWDFYQKARTGIDGLTVLNLYDGNTGKYYNEDEYGKPGGDGLNILAPTEKLVKEANDNKEYNDCSYVILYRVGNKKIIFAGDSAEKTWDYILQNSKEDISNVDLLIAPHHGRKTGGNREYLDVLKPKLTLFGNAKSQYLDYSSWSKRKLPVITNNEANCVIVNCTGTKLHVYVTNEIFANDYCKDTFYDAEIGGWYILSL